MVSPPGRAPPDRPRSGPSSVGEPPSLWPLVDGSRSGDRLRSGGGGSRPGGSSLGIAVAGLGGLALQTGFLDNLPVVLVVAGILLMGAEALAPGAHFIVLGVALLLAGLVGLALSAILPATVLALVLAGVVLGAGGLALYAYREFDLYGGKGTGRTSDSSSLRRKSGRVTERVSTTSGEVKLDDGGFNPYFRARSMDGEIAAGEPVMVLDPGGGNVLTVEPLGAVEGSIDRELARGREREAGGGTRERGDGERESA
jgi:membrane protein implicated in regulation of membrane protease activity